MMKNILLALTLSLTLFACETIDYDELREQEMRSYYQQSESLTRMSVEDLTHFCHRYQDYLSQEPKAKTSEYHSRIEHNITTALEYYHLTIEFVYAGWSEPVEIEMEVK